MLDLKAINVIPRSYWKVCDFIYCELLDQNKTVANGVVVVCGRTRSYPNIGIVMFSSYPHHRWRRWLSMPSLILKSCEQESQESYFGCSWESITLLTVRCRSTSRWRLVTKIASRPLVIRHVFRFAGKISQVAGSLLACVRDVFNGSLKRSMKYTAYTHRKYKTSSAYYTLRK